MPWPEASLSPILLRQEIRVLLGSGSLWLTLILLSLLVGFSFIEAVDLYAQASRTALRYPALAAGMKPVEGVFVPTFGAYYLVETLLLPFVVIRPVGQDRASGNLKLLLQMPVSPFALIGLKSVALAAVGPLIALPALIALVTWWLLGGFIPLGELSVLLLGHALYALTIACIALFAAVIADSLATAALICLGITLGAWALDFAAERNSWLAALAHYSLTGLLKPFEQGLLASAATFGFLLLSLLFFLLAGIFLHPGWPAARRLRALAIVFPLIAGLGWLALAHPGYRDVTEDRRHSLNPADQQALGRLDEPLTIVVHMTPDDSRAVDLERSLLQKLRRSVPRLQVIYAATEGAAVPFAAPGDDTYGMIEFRYAGHRANTYTSNTRQILSLIYSLAGLQVQPVPQPAFRGHPLVADAGIARWWFYLVLPALFGGAAILPRLGRKTWKRRRLQQTGC